MIFNQYWSRIEEEQFRQNVIRRRVIIFGASPRNTLIFGYIGQENVACIYDNDDKKWGTFVDNIQVLPPKACGPDTILVSVVNDYHNLIPQMRQLSDKVYFILSDAFFKEHEKYYKDFVKAERFPFMRPSRGFKYIHVIPDEKFVWCLFEVIESAFHMSEHLFVIYSVNKDDRYHTWDKYEQLKNKYCNIYLVDGLLNWRAIPWKKRLDMLDLCIANCRQLIFHGEWLDIEILNYFSCKKNIIQRKGVWIIWYGNVGGDSCCDSSISEVLKFARVIACGRDDETYLRIKEKYDLPSFHIRLNNKLTYSRFIEKPAKQKNDKWCNVFVGHSCRGYSFNLDTLKLLARADFKDKISVYCITSYGEPARIREVVEYGQKHFPGRFYPIKTFLPYDEYVQLLNCMDVAVLGIEIKAAHSTRLLLHWLGVKLYLKKNSYVYNDSVRQGEQIYDYYSIPCEEFESFMCFPEEEKKSNFELARENFEKDYIVRNWRELFTLDMDRG